MGADHPARRPRRPRSRGRRPATTVLLACGALLLAACASMPDSGDVHRVDSSPPDDVDSQVRVYGVRPGHGEQPMELVSGFLEATTSDEENFGTAKEYLTAKEAQTWRPFTGVTVLEDAPVPKVEPDAGRDGDGVTVVLSGTQVARVTSRHVYVPRKQHFEARVHLTKDDSEWRIDSLPNGLVLGESDFQRIYHSVNRYYFAELGPDVATSSMGGDVLVADPVYLRRRIDPVTATVKALLDGPTTWLNPVVRTAFPRGTALVHQSGKLAPDDSDTLKIQLTGRAVDAGQDECRQMAAQVLFTVRDEGSAKIGGVRLEHSDGAELCSLSSDGAQAYAPDQIEGDPQYQYFVDADHRMVRLSDVEDGAHPVPGPFGERGAGLRSVAVSRDEQQAAGVSRDGRSLYVTGMTPEVRRGAARLHSASAGSAYGFAAPSWDGLGDLWVADRDPDGPRLVRLHQGTGAPKHVRMPDLGGGRIAALRVSADGTRIALQVQRGAHTTLWLGRVERRGGRGGPELSVAGLRRIAPRLEEVDAMAWAGSSRLVVAGREPGGVQQLQYVETDGSPANVPAVPGPNRVEAVAAPDNAGRPRPLLAATLDGIVRMRPNGDWQTVARDGAAPVYPG
ncbi:LpqB family beta-propeller domain-containing protein [Streptomyces sp. B1866]|uniref:LpqB family beta-propeller domain-containing protein n=1 Tax=Streptomyces sp. B1866 TaxID=3075431 RepID=UPI00288F1E93|nr:LpqB family beta-propeller domain-containing protein [Streptomyces sp. B1866]MDT3399263.1 LpqB family beta-propeller domain-containing protein [Streptomyces sp. B1866]